LSNKRSYGLKCPREGRDVTLFFKEDGVSFSCSEIRMKFIKQRGKLEPYFICALRGNGCPDKEITYLLLKKIEPESYLKEE